MSEKQVHAQYTREFKLEAVRQVRAGQAIAVVANPYDGHTLDETLEQVGILCGTDKKPHTAIVDKGYKGAKVEGVRILMSGQKRGITQRLKAMIKRRSAIEPTIGHMKMDGRLDRNPLKGALGDAIHAVMCGAGHNLRLILAALRLYCARMGWNMQAVIAQLLALRTVEPPAFGRRVNCSGRTTYLMRNPCFVAEIGLWQVPAALFFRVALACAGFRLG